MGPPWPLSPQLWQVPCSTTPSSLQCGHPRTLEQRDLGKALLSALGAGLGWAWTEGARWGPWLSSCWTGCGGMAHSPAPGGFAAEGRAPPQLPQVQGGRKYKGYGGKVRGSPWGESREMSAQTLQATTNTGEKERRAGIPALKRPGEAEGQLCGVHGLGPPEPLPSRSPWLS